MLKILNILKFKNTKNVCVRIFLKSFRFFKLKSKTSRSKTLHKDRGSC